jgi:multidrug efflux system outer membrane protein
MNKRITQLLGGAWTPLLAALVLAGCASAPPALDDKALVATPAAFKAGDARWTQAAPAEAQARGEWWKAFNDPVLNELVERATASNASIQIAAARLAQANALVRSVDADRMPQLGISAGATRSVEPGVVPNPTTRITAGAKLSYELDLFGRLRQATDAATLDAQAREALLRSTQLLVQADVAQTYLALRALDAERALVRDTVRAYGDTLQLTERRYKAGDVAELDVMRVRTESAATESEAFTMDRQRAALQNALAVLVGDTATAFELPAGDWNAALPVIPAGLPSTVLARRPDVSAAQRGMQAAQARVGVAKAAWFPSLSLTANGGGASSELGDLFKLPARAWGIGALLSLPLFDGGRREAQVQSASAQLDEALVGYRQQVLVAFKDVEDQLAALQLLAQQSEVQSSAVASSSRATKLSDSRYRNGLVSQLELLDAQRSELRNRRQALQVRSAQYQATVGLVRAIGGDWGDARPVAATASDAKVAQAGTIPAR